MQGTEKLENIHKSLKDKNNSLKRETIEANLQYTNIKHNLSEGLNALKISNQHEIDFYTANNEALQVCIILQYFKARQIN